MSYSDPQNVIKAKSQADQVLSNHVMVDEPCRAFRFHAHHVDRRYENGRQDTRPGFVSFQPREAVRFGYSSFYAFSLVWTPGQMTIVGDLGNLTVSNYHAMGSLEKACAWLLSPDYGYLLSKTGVERVFDRDGTIRHLWEAMIEYVDPHLEAMREADAEWQARRPKWRKKEGMSRDEYEDNLKHWESDNPRSEFRFQPQPIGDGWIAPEGFGLIYRCWDYFREYSHRLGEDPNSLLTEEGRSTLLGVFEHWAGEEATDVIVTWIVRELDYDDYYGEYDYPNQAYLQISAMQHGCGKILESLTQGKPLEIQNAA